jgi:deferrochelatase/peroxidase EfeB
VKHPKADPQSKEFQDEDGFAYLATSKSNDRDGAACPLGAHVRRTNPRDWDSGATRLESVTIANRHRIIRRGRPYGDLLTEDMSPEALLARSRNPAQAPERGLQFLAFCADLERQFEFVQQQWSQNFTFAGLHAAPDPINGTSLAREVASACSFTIQKDAKQSSFGRCVGLADFIRVRGSAYFFMPSLSAVAALKPTAEAPSERANRIAVGVTVDE